MKVDSVLGVFIGLTTFFTIASGAWSDTPLLENINNAVQVIESFNPEYLLNEVKKSATDFHLFAYYYDQYEKLISGKSEEVFENFPEIKVLQTTGVISVPILFGILSGIGYSA